MSRRLLPGFFALAISLALVGVVVNAEGIAATGQLSSHSTGVATNSDNTPGDQATAQVPLRRATLDDGSAADMATPVSVRVASIGLEAPVLSVGVDDENQFDVPEADLVGWYRYGSAPGQTGSTVLAAHVAYGGQPGAFLNLTEIEVGELLEVELSDGSVMSYRVLDNVLYDKTALPADELFRKDGDAVLRLITCGGQFDPDDRSYHGNVVVTAEPIDV